MNRFLLVLYCLFLALPLLIINNAYAQSSLSVEAHLVGIKGKAQSYHLDCEIRSAVDLAAYYKIQISEDEFLSRLPRSDNPNEGFVGDPDGEPWGGIPPNNYGVHAAPIAATLRAIGIPAQEMQTLSLEMLKTEIANGRPVIVWVIGHVWHGRSTEYITRNGNRVTVAKFEHTMLAVGYNQNQVMLIDAGNGKEGKYTNRLFLESWGVLGNMAVVVKPPVNRLFPTPFEFQNTATPVFGFPQPEVNIPVTGMTLFPTIQMMPTNYSEPSVQNYPTSTFSPSRLRIPSLPEAISFNSGLPTPPATSTPGSNPGFNLATLTIIQSIPTTLPENESLPVFYPVSVELHDARNTMPTYTVQPGEFLLGIARKLNLDWLKIAELNYLKEPYYVLPGQILFLPVEPSVFSTMIPP